jgi:hypothetical protein
MEYSTFSFSTALGIAISGATILCRSNHQPLPPYDRNGYLSNTTSVALDLLSHTGFAIDEDAL